MRVAVCSFHLNVCACALWPRHIARTRHERSTRAMRHLWLFLLLLYHCCDSLRARSLPLLSTCPRRTAASPFGGWFVRSAPQPRSPLVIFQLVWTLLLCASVVLSGRVCVMREARLQRTRYNKLHVSLWGALESCALIVVRIMRSRDNRSPRRILAAVRCRKRRAHHRGRHSHRDFFFLHTCYIDVNRRINC